MIDRDRIAYLQELAISHFNDGNIGAAASAWRQVLEMDPSNVEAQKGMALAEQRLGGGNEAGPFGGAAESDADATVMFTPDQVAQIATPPQSDPFGTAEPAAPVGGGFDADRTMVVRPGMAAPPLPPAPSFDADRTMAFNPANPPRVVPRAPAPPPPAPAAGGAFDAEKTMLFGAPPGAPPRPAPAQPAAGFDAESTMLFGTPAPAAPRPAPAQPAGSFDAESTMLFGTPPPASPAPPASGGAFDAEKTMLFGAPPPAAAPPSWGPPPAAPAAPPASAAPPAWGAPPAVPAPPAARPAAGPPTPPAWAAPPPAAAPAPPTDDWLGSLVPKKDSDATIMSPEPTAPPPPPAPLAYAKPAPAAAGGRQLEDFVLPTGGLEMAGPGAPPALGPPGAPPMFGSPGAPPLAGPPSGAPGLPPASGFSFELPPPPSAKGGGGGFDLPELPSLGPPPTFTPSPAAPVVAAPKAKKGSAQFGEIDAGEAESLAVPTIGQPEAPAAEATPDEVKAREEEMKRRYEQQYGRSTPAEKTAAAVTAARAAAPRSKMPTYALLAFLVLMGAAYVVITYVIPKKEHPVTPVPRPVVVVLTPEEAQQKILETLAKAHDATVKGDINGAAKLIQEARDIAIKANLPVPDAVTVETTELERERAYRAKFEKAQIRFCQGDYTSANIMFVELEQAKATDPEPGKYVERMYYNLGIGELQKEQPWEAVFYFENLAKRDPADTEAKDLLEFSKKFPIGSKLGYDYTHRVDPLSDRTAGCR